MIMLATRARRSTSAASYSDSEGAVVRAQIEAARSLLQDDGCALAAVTLNEGAKRLKDFSQQIFDHERPNRCRDAFRHFEGFPLLLQLLRYVTSQLDSLDLSSESSSAATSYVLDLLQLLSAILQDHWGNCKFFRVRVEKNGWTALCNSLEDFLEKHNGKFGHSEETKRRIFGGLLSCALHSTAGELFQSLEGKVDDHQQDGLQAEADSAPHDMKRLQAALGKDPQIDVPQFLWLLFSLWASKVSTAVLTSRSTSVLVPLLLRCIAESSTSNLAALHRTKVLSKALPLGCIPQLDESVQREVEQLCVCLLSHGTSHFEDARFLFEQSSSNTAAARILLRALNVFKPPYIHFDLCTLGHAAIEVPAFGREFPPPPSVLGYTLSVWIQVVCFDTEAHTTIFGAFDASQKCFVLVYLEKDTKNLILQTSVTSSKPSVRFKSFVFEQSKWYHVAIVHRRPTAVSSSRASLFVNGEFVEQAKAHFPSAPSPRPSESGEGNGKGAKRKSHTVQAFLGTPHDLAVKHGPGLARSQWRLASAYLVNEAVSDDLIAVHHQLGPRYFGNFQDCLGSFQTYEASAALNLRNENLHPGKEEKSDIVAAIRAKASTLLPESRILLNVSPTLVFDESADNSLTGTILHRSLSKTASRNLRNATRDGRTAVAVNAAIPAVNEALLHRSGMAMLTGATTLAVPEALDDSAWRMGGCAPIILRLFDAADSHDDILRSLSILFATIRNSWRNSEAMERENGFSVLASVLSVKLSGKSLASRQLVKDASADSETHDLAHSVLSMILEFVGYKQDRKEDSIIVNPLAYRILLVDLDLWRLSSPSVQRRYFEQFETFVVGSKYHNFNTKRLARMRITRKWLDALKCETFYQDSLDIFLKAFRFLLTGLLSAETHRAIAMYITYAIHKSNHGTPLPPSSKSVKRKQTAPASMYGSSTWLEVGGEHLPSQGHVLPLKQVGVQVLALYVELLCQKDVDNVKKFARTVTNKWLLYLLAHEDPTVITYATRLLARVLVVNGPAYVHKFSEKTGGFVIMQNRLRRHWAEKPLWLACFAILFGCDVASVDFDAPFTLSGMLTAFNPSKIKVLYPNALFLICAMLQSGSKSIVQDLEDPQSPPGQGSPHTPGRQGSLLGHGEPRTRSKSLQVNTTRNGLTTPRRAIDSEYISIIMAVARFLTDLHSSSANFRDFAVTTVYTQELISLLFPIIVSTDAVSPDTELNSQDSALTFNGSDVIIRPISQASQRAAPIVRTTSVENHDSPTALRTQQLKRGSSFVLITAGESKHQPSSARLDPVASPKSKSDVLMHVGHSLVEIILEMIVAIFTDQILSRKDFVGMGLFMKVPPGFQEHQAYFESFVLQNTLTSLSNTLKLRQSLLSEPRVLTNLQRFCAHLDEAVYEGWFINGAQPVLDFICELLEYLQRPDISQLKSVRLCSEVIASMRIAVGRICLMRLSEPDHSEGEKATVLFLRKLTYWQSVLFATERDQETFPKLFSYLLYGKLVSSNPSVRDVSIDLWRTFLVHQHDEASLLKSIVGDDNKSVLSGFDKIMELDNDAFAAWIDDHRSELDAIFFGRLAASWDSFVGTENRRTQDTYKARVAKRRDKLRQWVEENAAREDILRQYDVKSNHWRANIYVSEHQKHQRSVQDGQDAQAFNETTWDNMLSLLRRPYGLLDTFEAQKWQLDLTEGRSRMRLRMTPDRKAHSNTYRAKGDTSAGAVKHNLVLDVSKAHTMKQEDRLVSSPTDESQKNGVREDRASDFSVDSAPPKGDIDDDYEMVDEPASEAFEDKNRKVMRSLQRSDQVEHVHNVSRIVGLEACEGLLILGKVALYLMDDFFHRSDGEIVYVWQAPADERDGYMQMISGRETATRVERSAVTNRETRSWRWDEVLSISKRRFLFREVGIEIFFLDGRSYLLTFAMPKFRDEVFQRLFSKVPSVSSNAVLNSPEYTWRIEALRTPEDSPQSLGTRFSSVFAQGLTSPVTKKWVKGEISNFAYLMHINTTAGRTFNDLTQYPVFPWVLADYTSDELDLTNPRTFRDLTKPMGCQTAERQMEFRERYQTFAEMADHDAPPFHYGTHYSSAMIVTSYLIRLEPFVQSYLLLQGGSFDHADRLFYSVQRAWTSASRENMTDVRELIPEFYYLPEMFVNSNAFDFGARQSNGRRIDNVELPRWAKGDPNIFIAKHREALESDYVSKHLHQWIDLIFGQKQRGEAAIEATNVFHHLSYHGARNLDEISDPVERMATIGIIHNFGQTPHQVFQRSHPARQDPRSRTQRLDTLASSLTKLPFPLLETPDRVSSLTYSHKTERLLCTGAFRLNMPPYYDVFVDWGFVDGSIRFFATESGNLLTICEHLHQTQISAAAFVDARTLITAGEDSVISLWTVSGASKRIELTLKGSFFGHRAAVTCLALSLSFSTLVSAAADGSVLLWDLNRRDLVRVLARGGAQPPVDCACVHDADGTIALGREPSVALHTLNGAPLVEQNVCVEGDEAVTCLAFYEGVAAEHVEHTLLFTGHRRGAVNVWALSVHGASFALAHVKRMVHADAAGMVHGAAITCVLPRALTVYTGDDDGRVVSDIPPLRCMDSSLS